MEAHLFIDGSWLFRACADNGVLANRTCDSTVAFDIDFNKMKAGILKHINDNGVACSGWKTLNFVTSILEIPSDINTWAGHHPGCTADNIRKLLNNITARNHFAQKAIDAGFDPSIILRPMLKPYMVKKIAEKAFQEKQVDTTVVALLIKSAFQNPNDVHVFITGDADILPAIQVAYPQYTQQVLLATSHPDELNAIHRSSSYSLSQFTFSLPVFYFQDHIKDLLTGDFIFQCDNCAKYYSSRTEFSALQRPRCSKCMRLRR